MVEEEDLHRQLWAAVEEVAVVVVDLHHELRAGEEEVVEEEVVDLHHVLRAAAAAAAEVVVMGSAEAAGLAVEEVQVPAEEGAEVQAQVPAEEEQVPVVEEQVPVEEEHGAEEEEQGVVADSAMEEEADSVVAVEEEEGSAAEAAQELKVESVLVLELKAAWVSMTAEPEAEFALEVVEELAGLSISASELTLMEKANLEAAAAVSVEVFCH